MKAFKKIVLAMLISCLLVVPFAGTAHAEDLADPDAMKSILAYFKIDLNDPASIQKAIDEIKEGGISGFLNILGIDISEILDELSGYLSDMSPSTTKPQETTTEEPETTTEAPETTTEEPTTAPPVYVPPTYPSYYTPPATTLPPETTTFQFIPPEQIYTEAFTTTVFKPIVEDDISSAEGDTSPIKTAIGVLLLLGSGIGVIIVVLALKRNRI